MDITNQVLLPKHIDAGLKLEKKDDHILMLKTQGGRIVAAFSTQIEADLIRSEADNFLKSIDYNSK